MNPQRMLGAALLVVGVVLLVMGMNASHSLADQATNTFAGHFTDRTTWFIVGGIGTGILGGLMMMFGAGGKHA
jgi:hypothetical protein